MVNKIGSFFARFLKSKWSSTGALLSRNFCLHSFLGHSWDTASKVTYTAGCQECSEVAGANRGKDWVGSNSLPEENLRMSSSVNFKSSFWGLGYNFYINNLVSILEAVFTLNTKVRDWHSGSFNALQNTRKTFLNWFFFSVSSSCLHDICKSLQLFTIPRNSLLGFRF